jgi:hypothetical protein
MITAHHILAVALPEHLTPKADQGSAVIVGVLLASIVLIALARLREQHLFLYLFQGIFALKPLDELSRDSYRPSSTGSVLLTLLYMLVSAGTVYWLISVNPSAQNSRQWLLPVVLPSAYLLYQLLLPGLAARIIDRGETIADVNYSTLIIMQFFAVILLLELFMSYFQRGLLFDSFQVVAVTFVVFQALRLVRGFWLGINQGISWYYIILYFWTLEILPLLILVKLLYFKDFHV